MIALFGVAALALTCPGNAMVGTRSVGYASIHNWTTGQNIGGESVRRDQDHMNERLSVQINGDAGRIRAPLLLQSLPRIHAPVKDGWFPLYDLEVTDDHIIGHFKINFTRHPTVTIDRHSGAIDVNGDHGDYAFSGQCEVDQTPVDEHKF